MADLHSGWDDHKVLRDAAISNYPFAAVRKTLEAADRKPLEAADCNPLEAPVPPFAAHIPSPRRP